MIQLSWNQSIEPAKMLAFLRESDRLSERKARLYAAACCRHIWPLLADERARTAVEIAEQYADSLIGDRQRYAARAAAAEAANQARHAVSSRPAGGSKQRWRAAGAATFAASSGWQVLEAADWASLAAGEEENCERRNKAGYAEQDYQSLLLRHLFNPFRLPKSAHVGWKTVAVQAQAAKAYERRLLSTGALDPAQINVLFDALVSAGCRESDLLDHLGAPEPHPPGCWAVDLLLSKT